MSDFRPIRTKEDLTPLLDYYAGVLGKVPGELMAALSILVDLEYMNGWHGLSREAQLSVHLARDLVAGVFKQVLAEDAETDVPDDVRAILNRWTRPGRSDG